SDLPANKLVFSLDAGAPSGAAINSTNGVFSWTPTEAQGPGTNTITIRVTDDGAPTMSDAKTFTVIVNEVNSPPVLAPIGNKSIDRGGTVGFTVNASDSDIPTNTLTFSLDSGAPAGATIHPQTGVFTWTDNAGPGTYPVTVRVSDNGAP